MNSVQNLISKGNYDEALSLLHLNSNSIEYFDRFLVISQIFEKKGYYEESEAYQMLDEFFNHTPMTSTESFVNSVDSSGWLLGVTFLEYNTLPFSACLFALGLLRHS